MEYLCQIGLTTIRNNKYLFMLRINDSNQSTIINISCHYFCIFLYLLTEFGIFYPSPVLLNQFFQHSWANAIVKREAWKLLQSPNFKYNLFIFGIPFESRDTDVQPYSLQINSSAHPELPAAGNATVKTVEFMHQRDAFPLFKKILIKIPK